MLSRLITLLGSIALAGCATTTTERQRLPPLATVPRVDLDRYLGTWYDIASFPQRFQRGCTATTATYTKRPDGQIDVLNRCRRGSLDGKETSASGRARVVDRATNAKLEVSFFRPFWADYWIIDLGPDYAYAVVGHPSRDYLWILSRRPTMATGVYEGIMARLRAQGYEVGRLKRTPQPVEQQGVPRRQTGGNLHPAPGQRTDPHPQLSAEHTRDRAQGLPQHPRREVLRELT